MEVAFWLKFVAVILLQVESSKLFCLYGNDRLYFVINNASLIIAETANATNECATLQKYNFTDDDLQIKLNVSSIPGCFNLTLNISTIKNLSYDKRYHFGIAKTKIPTDVLTTCYPISNKMKQCNLTSVFLLQTQRFIFQENLVLEDRKTGRTFGLGDYFITTLSQLRDSSNYFTEFEFDDNRYHKVVIICDDNDDPAEMPFCQPIELSVGEYELLPNGIYLPWKAEMLWFPAYKDTPGKNGSINLCYPLKREMRQCKNIERVEGKAVKIRADQTIGKIFIPSKTMILELGKYYATSDFGNVTVCPNTAAIFDKDKIRRINTIIFIASAVSLLVTLLLHLAVPSINPNAEPLLNYIFSLMSFYFAMIIRNFNRHVEAATVRYIMFSFCHFFSLTTFFWLSVLSFDLWRNFSELNDRIGRRSCFRSIGCKCNKKSRFIIYCMYAWGIPAIMVGCALMLEFNPELQNALHLPIDIYTRMWFKEQNTGLVFFYGPIAAIVFENLIFFTLTMLNLKEVSKGTRSVNKDLSRQMLIVCIKLFVIMGFNWIIEVAGFVGQADPKVLFVPDLINCMAGFIIFVLFICKRSTLKAIRRKYQKSRHTRDSMHLTVSSTLAA